MFTREEQTWLLKLARESIAHFLETGKKLKLKESEIEASGESVKIKRACFVTLKKDLVELRGCMGSLEARRPLYLDILENAYAAAFEDSRFFPVTKEELPDVNIEISVLTDPKVLEFDSPEDLFNKLRVGVDGVVVERGEKNATFLPQVWDEMLEKSNFLTALCMKAGLEPEEWKKPGLTVYTYQVEVFSED
ncbi:MAG: AmmeMemoRadiSam system protein A [Candidatus Magasanikbacteria bacterium]|nr:AmmeMemoRadiSam system protein A [Candidatus Magasanikbacteria bacterium]